MRLPTWSEHDRAFKCIGATVLPRIEDESPAGDKGTWKHLWIAHPGTDAEALEVVPSEFREACSRIDRDALGVDRKTGVAEVALAYNWRTGKGRELGRGGDKSVYANAVPDEFRGTADWVSLTNGGRTAFVLDWKTGRSRVTAAKDNRQLRGECLALARAHGCEDAKGVIVYIPEDGSAPYWDPATFDAFELDAIAGELADLAKRQEKAETAVDFGEQPPLRTGSHCGFCKCYAACPAYRVVLQTLATQPEKAAEDLQEMLAHPETERLAYERWQMLRSVMKKIEGVFRVAAFTRPILAGPGMVYGPVESQGEEWDGETTFEVLNGEYGTAVAAKACEFKTSKAGIDRGMRVRLEEMKKTDWKPPCPDCEGTGRAPSPATEGECERCKGKGEVRLTLAVLNEEALKLVRKAGGSRLVTKTELREHRAALPAQTEAA